MKKSQLLALLVLIAIVAGCDESADCPKPCSGCCCACCQPKCECDPCACCPKACEPCKPCPVKPDRE